MKFESPQTPDAWRQAVAEKFRTTFGISEQDIVKLQALPPRAIFEILTGKTLENKTSAIHYMVNFPSPQTADFLQELL